MQYTEINQNIFVGKFKIVHSVSNAGNNHSASKNYNAAFKIAGFNGDYIVCDYVWHGDNMRKVLKRNAE